MGGNGKSRWIISFLQPSSNSSYQQPPKEFICSISGSLMSDPVVVTSGQTFERISVQVCRELDFSPKLEDGTRPNFTTMIPNLLVKSTILHWCENAGLEHPRPPDYSSVESLVRASMEKSKDDTVEPQLRVSEMKLLKGVADNPPVIFSHAVTEMGHRVNHFNSSSSEESAIVTASPATPLHLKTRPSCYSYSSSSDALFTETQNPTHPISEEDEQLLAKLQSAEVFEQEQGVISLRNITKTKEETRVSLCTPRLLSALRPLVISRDYVVQTNAVASVVNLSIEKPNKVKIVRSGIVPPLIDILKGGLGESQEHAAGALFSLAIDDDNKMALGVLGAMQPLMYALRSESERTRDDSALALYHLTLIQSNRVKLMRLGAVPTLLSILKSNSFASRVLLILCNLAVCPESRVALLDSNAVECLVDLLRQKEYSEFARENCVAALCALSHGSLRFKVLAREARAVELLKEIEERGSERAKDKAKRILQIMRAAGDDEDDQAVYLDRLLDSGSTPSRAWFQIDAGSGRNTQGPNSTTF